MSCKGTRLPDPNPSSQTLRRENARVTDGWQELAGRQQEFRFLQRPSCALSPSRFRSRVRAAASGDFAPASYVGSLDPHMIWEAADRRHRRGLLPWRDRPVGALGPAHSQAVPAPAQRLHQFRAEPSQPGRRDDRSEGADRVLQRTLSRNLRACRAPTCRNGMDGPQLLELRRSRGVLDVSVEDFYSQGRDARRPHHRTAERAGRFWSSIFRCRMAVRSRPIWIAPISAGCRANWRRPPSSWNRCSTTCRCAWPPRTSRTAATSSPTAPSSASRASPAITSSASAPTRSFKQGDRSQHRDGGPVGAAGDGGLSPQRIRRRARFGEARPCLQPRDRAQRERRAGIPDRAVRRRHRPPLAVARAGEHQEVPRARGRQHPGLADRRTRQRRQIFACQPQRRRPSSTAAARTPPA